MILPLLPRSHVFTKCFEIHCRLDLHTATEDVNLLIEDLTREPFSIEQATQHLGGDKQIWVWGSAMKGMVAYHLRGISSSPLRFQSIFKG